jgi:hypothetical protein
MKYFIFLLGLFWLCADAKGQTSCFTSDFSSACDNTVTYFGCPTWTSSCGAGWLLSHGTPEMKKDSFMSKGGTWITYHYAYMWSRSNNTGEGMYTPYAFQANHSYDVTITFRTFTGDNSIHASATSAFSPHTPGNCGETPPSVSAASIGTATGLQSSTTDQVFTFPPFTPNTNYSELWLYPTTSASLSELAVFQVSVCPSCTGVITYNSGAVPAGNTAAGYVNMGSSAGAGGAGTVTVASGSATDVSAANEINILPSFQATLTAGGSFYAHIVPCSNLLAAAVKEGPIIHTIHRSDPNQPMTIDLKQRRQEGPASLQVYPTVSAGLVYIKGGANDLVNMNVQVFDEAGRSMYQTHSTNHTLITIDLSGYRNGVYFLHMTNGAGTTVRKVIINK